MTATDIPLRDLHENSYNPRKRFDDAAMADLKESIENVGLNQPPTVRQNADGYEVVAGIRRLTALRQIHGEDSDVEIPCNVRELDDDDARLVALNENLTREDLTPVEEAWEFADYVEVDYRDEGPESYAEYIKGVKDGDAIIPTPDSKKGDIQELADNIAPSPSVIMDRLRLLPLPTEVLGWVETGDLSQRPARDIAKELSQIPNAEFREKHMNQLANQVVADSLSESEVRERAKNIRAKWQKEQNREEEKREKFEEQAQAAFDALRNETEDKLEWYNEHADESCSPDVSNGYVTLVNSVLEAYQSRVSELGGDKQTALDDEIQDVRTEKSRLEDNIQLVRDEDHSRCPFCKAHVLIPDLEDRVSEYDSEIQVLNEQKEELSSEREEYKSRRSDLRDKRNEYENALSNLDRYTDEDAKGLIEG